jgi:RNase P subunit RPR2
MPTLKLACSRCSSRLALGHSVERRAGSKPGNLVVVECVVDLELVLVAIRALPLDSERRAWPRRQADD